VHIVALTDAVWFACISVGHTSERVEEMLVETFRDWGILEKIMGGTVDGAAYFPPLFVRRGWIQFRCAAHMLNTVVTDALEICAPAAFTKMHALIKHFTRSSMDFSILAHFQRTVMNRDGAPLVCSFSFFLSFFLLQLSL